MLLHPGTTVAQLVQRWEVCGDWCAQTASRFSWLLRPWKLRANLGCSIIGRWLHPAFFLLFTSTRPMFKLNSLVELLQLCPATWKVVVSILLNARQFDKM
jgi:hypothetical protein